nr:Ig-like domain-containing protein [Bacteroidota bacterium]
MGQIKNFRFFANYSLIAIIVSFLISCAQVGSPAGGPVDTTPPKIVKSYPENNSVKFNGKSIVLEFDEYVQVKDVTNQLLISPPLDKPPELKIKGKSVIIAFEGTLKDSTTYTFNFGSSISDFTEGNPLDSNLFVFSTGTFLDSLSIKGKVKNILDGSVEKDIYVMLYSNLEDSVPYKNKPLYLTRTEEDGSFSINNIR